jgi:hypothetical protein
VIRGHCMVGHAFGSGTVHARRPPRRSPSLRPGHHWAMQQRVAAHAWRCSQLRAAHRWRSARLWRPHWRPLQRAGRCPGPAPATAGRRCRSTCLS